MSTYTYSGNPSQSSRDAIRFLIQDTDSSDWLLSNEEIEYTLTAADDSVYQAAHDCCTTIAARFTRLADTSKSVGDISLSYSYGNRAQAYLSLGDNILAMSLRRDPPRVIANMESLAKPGTRTSDTTTSFWVTMEDNKGY